MKKLLFPLLLFYFSSTFSQTFTVVLTADSHGQNIPTGGSDSLWINQYVNYLDQFYPSVTLKNLSIGGTTIGGVMPAWYTYTYAVCGLCQPNSLLNIDTVLKLNPDLVIICMTGNQTTNGMPADTSLWCFRYLIDTLSALQKPFIITGQFPRQKTFTPPITLQSYYDTSIKINQGLSSKIPNNWVDAMPLLMDNIRGIYPWPFVLASDSLHLSDYGERMAFWMHRDSWITDSLLTNYKADAINFTLAKSGSNVTISGSFRYNTIYVKGSNDLVNFTNIQTFVAANETATVPVTQNFPHQSYQYLQIVVYSKYLSKTILKTVN